MSMVNKFHLLEHNNSSNYTFQMTMNEICAIPTVFLAKFSLIARKVQVHFRQGRRYCCPFFAVFSMMFTGRTVHRLPKSFFPSNSEKHF